MQLGIVVGTATSTVKHPSLERQKLLIVQFLAADGRAPDGDPVLAVDGLGAGIGERVLLTSDGKVTREFLQSDTTPVRWSVLGIPE